jgi:hypothetical protein
MLLNFRLWNTHINHVGHQLNGSLNCTGVKVCLIGNRSLNTKLFQASSEVMDFALQTRGINVGQGEQLVNAGPHHMEEVQGRL